jgi:hypothetical protein
MPNFQITELSIIVIAICATIAFCLLLFKAKDGFKFKVDKSGIDLEVADEDDVNLPENKEFQNETNTV